MPPLSVLAAPFVPAMAGRLRAMLNLPDRAPGPLLPEETLPEGLRKNSSELRRNLDYWAAPMTPEELRAYLANPAVPLDQRLRPRRADRHTRADE